MKFKDGGGGLGKAPSITSKFVLFVKLTHTCEYLLLIIFIEEINSSSSSLNTYLLCDSWSETDTESLVPLCVCQRVGVVGSLLAETGPQGLSAIQIHQGRLTTLQNGWKQYLSRIQIWFKLTKGKDLIDYFFIRLAFED